MKGKWLMITQMDRNMFFVKAVLYIQKVTTDRNSWYIEHKDEDGDTLASKLYFSVNSIAEMHEKNVVATLLVFGVSY